MKTKLAIGAVILAVAAVLFAVLVLEQARYADDCASELLARARAKDKAYLSAAIRSPAAKAAIEGAAERELEFVRPSQDSTARIGLMLRDTESSTIATPLFLMLTSAEGECTFIQDYDGSSR